MAISVQCGECGARYNVNESMAGKRAKCKKCGATMSIPAPADDLAEDDDLSALAELAPPPPKPPAAPPRGWTPESVIVETAPEEPRTRRRAASRGGGGGFGKLVFLLLLIGLVAGGVYVYQQRPAWVPAWILARLPGGPAPTDTGTGAVARKGTKGGATGQKTQEEPVQSAAAAETQKKRDETAEHLRQIYTALRADVAKNEQAWPADLATLQRAGALDAQNLTSPFGPAFPGPDYAYAPYVTKMTPAAEVVLAYDAAELGSEPGASVLFGDGSVKWLKRDEVQAALQQSQELRASAAQEREQQMAAARAQPNMAGAFPGDETSGAGTGAGAGAGSVGTVRDAQGVVGRLKASGRGVVKDAVAVPTKARAAEALLRPAMPSTVFALLSRGEQGNESIEVFGGSPPAAQATVSFPEDPSFRGHYALSADGKFLARLVSFPRNQAVVYSFEKQADVATLDLKALPGVNPNLVGFNGPDRLAVRWTRGSESALELWDVKQAKSLRRVSLPDLQRPSAANEAVSHDGRLFAVTGRSQVRGKDVLQLVVYTVVGPGDPRRFQVKGLDEQFLMSAEPAGVAFSPDGGKVAALFEVDGKGLVAAWNLRTGKPSGEFVLPAVEAPKDARMNNVRGLDWVAGGRALLVCGSTLIDADNGGAVLATLDAGKVRGQAVVGPTSVAVAYGEVVHIDNLAAVTLDEQKLPGASGTAR